MARLELYLLGPFVVALDGKPITSFESNKVRALLAYLVTKANQPQRREKLAELLWSGWRDGADREAILKAYEQGATMTVEQAVSLALHDLAD